MMLILPPNNLPTQFQDHAALKEIVPRANITDKSVAGLRAQKQGKTAEEQMLDEVESDDVDTAPK